MNKVILIGRLTKDPDIRYAQNVESMAIARFTLAVDRRTRLDGSYARDGQANFISCKAFYKQAEFAERYLRKGAKVAIIGRIETGSYTNREGQKVYTTDVVVEQYEFCDSKAANANHTEGGFEPRSSQPSPDSAIDDGFTDFPDDIDDDFINAPDSDNDDDKPF